MSRASFTIRSRRTSRRQPGRPRHRLRATRPRQPTPIPTNSHQTSDQRLDRQTDVKKPLLARNGLVRIPGVHESGYVNAARFSNANGVLKTGLVAARFPTNDVSLRDTDRSRELRLGKSAPKPSLPNLVAGNPRTLQHPAEYDTTLMSCQEGMTNLSLSRRFCRGMLRTQACTAMPQVTPRQLYDRLVVVTGAKTDEDLARRLDESLRTIQRLKAGNGVEFDRAVYLFQQAGWLTIDGEEANLPRAQVIASQIADRLEELADALGAPPAAREP